MEFFTSILIYTGVANAVYFSLAIYICWARNGFFSFKEYPVSIAGHNPKTARFFMVSTIVSGVLEAGFLYAIFTHFPELQHPLLIVLPGLGIASLIVAGVFHGPHYRMVHRGSVFVMFSSLLVWSCAFNYAMYQIDQVVGGVNTLLTVVAAFSALYYKFRYDMFGIAQLIFAGFVVIWNLLFTYAILMI